jgi:hypothetical protein
LSARESEHLNEDTRNTSYNRYFNNNSCMNLENYLLN